MRLEGHFLFASAMMLVSCTLSFEDPFASQPAGKRVFVQASLINKMPLTEAESSVKAKSYLIQFSESVDLPNFDSGKTAIAGQRKSNILSLAFVDKYGGSVKRTMAEVQGQPPGCAANQSDVQEFLRMYPNLSVICDPTLIAAMPSAKKILVTTSNLVEHEFTSWGITYSDFSGVQVLIYSISL